MVKCTSDRDQNLTDFLVQWLELNSRNKAKKYIESGFIEINGVRINDFRASVKPGDQICYDRNFIFRQAAECPLDVLYNDEYMVVIDKPAGLLTYGEKGSKGTSAYKILKEFFGTHKPKSNILVVHRLDRDVGGLLVFAKTSEIQRKLKDQWYKSQKKYYALVYGKPRESEGTIKNWLHEDELMRVYESVPGEGKHAITHYKILKEFETTTLLDIQIETGRKHQIRVHMAGLGCPIVGDKKYGIKEDPVKTIRLQSYYLRFTHPVTGTEVETEIPIRKKFTSLT